MEEHGSFRLMMERDGLDDERPSFWRRLFRRAPDPRVGLVAEFLRQLRADLDAYPERAASAFEVLLRNRKEPCSVVVVGTTEKEPRVPLFWAHTAWLRPDEERDGYFQAQTKLVDLTVIAFGAGRLRRVCKGIRIVGTTNLDGELPLARIEAVEPGEQLVITVVR